MVIMIRIIDNIEDYEEWVVGLYQLHHQARVIFISGELGAGKSTFARIWLRCAGVVGHIKSPSFSIIETYDSPALGVVHHVDCYRLQSQDDLLSLGFDDFLADHVIIEWPERVFEGLISPDLKVTLEIIGLEKRRCSTSINND